MKVLVTVASRHGATLQIADTIREELEGMGVRAHVVEPDIVADLSGYDAVVLGSAVYAGRWLAPARKLAERLEAQLLQKPVWLFSSGPVGEPAKPTRPPIEGIELARRLNAIDHQVFEGRLDRNRLGVGERAVVRIVGAPEGDYRPWLAIVAWAHRIATSLRSQLEPAAATV